MQPAPPGASTCPTCGGVLEKTLSGGLGCKACLLRAGIGSEEETVHESTPDALEGGPRFGVYEIDCHPDGSLYELGRGAMGVTYRATDTSLQRKVALKIIKTDIAERNTDARERFMREARAAAALRHENIATVHQFGMRLETGQYFYAMELIEGETLEDRVRRAGPLDAPATIQIAQQVTSALTAAEKHGLVHRDLKPANLMLVSHDGETSNNKRLLVKIIDFGLAKAIHTATDPKSLTHDRFVGTPAFASPEQFEHSALDVRSDIYSLGETLWFALTGKTPFAGRSVEEIHRAQKSDVLPIEQLKAAHVPSRLRSVLESMLAFEPASRPGTQKLAARLQSCSPEGRTIRRTRVTLAAAALLIFAASAVIVFLLVRTKNSISNLAAPEKSIAVLPFENRSEDKSNAYFADGIQDEILTRLSNIADLKVISRTSTRQYQSKPTNLREIAKQLDVATILEGSVQKVGDQVRVNVQLINAQTDSHLWADSYDRNLTDIFGVESEIAKQIAESLQAKLSGPEKQALAVKPTNNPEAYDAYLRGLAIQTRIATLSPDPLRKAIGFFERAVQLDPNFAPAWARLSRAHAAYYVGWDDPTSGRRDAAKGALEHAQKLQPNSPETLLALGYYQYWVLRDYGIAKTTFERVSKMLPNNSDVPIALGLITRREGKWNESVAYVERGLALDPHNARLLDQAASTYAMLRQFPTALKLYDRELDFRPNDPDLMAQRARMYQAEGNLQEAAKLLVAVNAQTSSGPALAIKITQLRLERNLGEAVRLLQARQAQYHFSSEIDKVTDQGLLAFTQCLAGDVVGAKVTAEQTRNTFERLCKDRPDNAAFAKWLTLSYAALGNKDSALKEAEHAIMLSADRLERLNGEEILAVIQTIFGENSGAISTLTQLLQTPYSSWLYFQAPVTPALLRLDPLWDPLRNDPAFQKLCDEKQALAPEMAAKSAPEKSIAVMPFENLSRDPDNAYFAQGIQEEILTRLAKIADLKVISRTSTQQYQSKPGNLSEIAKQLGVATIVEGSVQKVADQVRVNVQLIHAQNDSHLWAESYDRKLTDIFAVESEIAKQIAESLQAKLSGPEKQALAVKPTNNPEAYDAYLRGLAFEARSRYPFQTEDLAREAVGFYERAVQLDPNFAAAWARLSRAHAFLYFGGADTATRRDAAKSALEQAQRLDPNSAETLLALGYYQYRVLSDYGPAKTTFERVSKMLPNSSEVLLALARIARREGRWDQSVLYDEQALTLDPRNREILGDTSWNYVMLRHFPAALKIEDRVLDITPNDPTVIAGKASIYQAQGNLQEAARLLAAINEQTPSEYALDIKITQLSLERNYGEALRLLQAKLAQFHYDCQDCKSLDEVRLALIQQLAGDNAGARVTAEKARSRLEQLCRDQPDNANRAGMLSLANAALGEKDSALKEAERAIMLLPSAKNAVDGPAMEENLTVIQTMFRENSSAILTLTRLLRTPGHGWLRDTPITPALLRLDPIWDPLRADPAFQKLCDEK